MGVTPSEFFEAFVREKGEKGDVLQILSLYATQNSYKRAYKAGQFFSKNQKPLINL